MGTKAFARALVAVTSAATLVLGAAPAWAANQSKPVHGGGGGGGGGSAPGTGVDVSYPQCPGTSLPSGQAFAIVGVNGGLANDYNSCLSTEFSYAQASLGGTNQARAQLYLNTADPGNTVADWPSPSQPGTYGTTSTPSDGTCAYASGGSGPGANSPACAYIYGYDMVAGINYATGTVAGDLSAFSSATNSTLYSYPVWLDVETGNSWQSSTAPDGLTMNVADLQGMVDALNAAAPGSVAKQIGIYSTSYQWNQITGSPTAAGNLQNLPDWIPGARRESGAVTNCSLAPFTGGTVMLTQWSGTYDGDYPCV